jgi:NAD(P)-dependent dehydrogenase (short-subunit alcohol dehydrogenase family)
MSIWEGQVAVITGAGSGIGGGLARYAVSQGMQVVAADVDKRGLGVLAEELGDELWTRQVDVTDGEAVEELAQEVFDHHGRVNLLFNNAGVLVNGTSWLCSAEDWRWNFDVNVMGIVHGIRSFVPRMLGQGEAGRIINTGSIGGLLGGGAYMGIYQATKHAIVAMTESLYNELEMEQAPVSASVLCPGEVATGIGDPDRFRSEEEARRLKSTAEQQFHTALSQGIASGLQPDDFAARVFEAIAQDKFWLLPQPEFKPMVQLRTQSIIDETVPPNLNEMMGSD